MPSSTSRGGSPLRCRGAEKAYSVALRMRDHCKVYQQVSFCEILSRRSDYVVYDASHPPKSQRGDCATGSEETARGAAEAIRRRNAQFRFAWTRAALRMRLSSSSWSSLSRLRTCKRRGQRAQESAA